MSVLVDTSVWINHFRHHDPELARLLEDDQVLVHPFIIGELACGQLRQRKEIIDLLHVLPGVSRATDAEVLFFIDRHRLMGAGLSLIDIHLLASCMIDRCRIWTADKPLQSAAMKLDVA